MKRTDVHQAAILHSPPDDAVRRSLRPCDAGANTFAQSCIGYADRGGLEHPRVLVENLFDFARIDVGPAADNRLFLAIDNFQNNLLHQGFSDVAGSEPAIRAEAARIGRGVVEFVAVINYQPGMAHPFDSPRTPKNSSVEA